MCRNRYMKSKYINISNLTYFVDRGPMKKEQLIKLGYKCLHASLL